MASMLGQNLDDPPQEAGGARPAPCQPSAERPHPEPAARASSAGSPPRGSASTSTSRSAPGAATTAPLPPGPDLHHLAAAYVDACLTELKPRLRRRPRPGGTVFVGGGTPSQLPADELARLLGGIRSHRGSRGDRRVQSGGRHDRAPAHLRRRRREPHLARGAVARPARARRASAGATSPEAVAEAVGGHRRGRLRLFSVDLIYGAAGETDDDWAATLEGVLGLDPPPPHVSAYALQAEPGTPLGRDPARHPDDDVQARRYEMADAVLRRGRTGLVRDLQLVAAGPRVPAQPELLAPGRVPRRGLRRPQPSRRAPVLEHPHPRALHGCDRLRALGRWPARRASSRRPAPLEALELAIRTRDGVRCGARCPDDEALADLVETRPTAGRAHAPLAACSRTRWRAGCALRPKCH